MSSKSNQGGDLFSPLIEGLIEILQLFSETFVKFLANKIQFSFKPTSHHERMKIDSEMFEDDKQTTNPEHLGWSANQKGYYKLSYLVAHLHTFIIGASGWGKTNLLNILMEHNLRNKIPVIFIDPKGTRQGINDFKKLCEKYNRKCYVFSQLSSELTRFNPLEFMNADQALVMIMDSFNWGPSPNEYYLSRSKKALKLTLDKLYASKKRFGLHEVYKNLEAEFAIEETEGLRTQLFLLTGSNFGHLFDVSNSDTAVNFQKVWEERSCMYIGISTMGYRGLARTIGKMFVSELQTLADCIGATVENQQIAIDKSIGVFIDEIASVLFPDFIDLANKSRSSGLNLTIATQSYSDLEMVSGSETLMKQMTDAFSTWFVQRQLNPDNAEKLAQMFGTYLTKKDTHMTENGVASNKGSVREVHSYLCSPDHLKSMHIGKAALLTLSPRDVHLINIRDAKATQEVEVKISEKKFKDHLGGNP